MATGSKRVKYLLIGGGLAAGQAANLEFAGDESQHDQIVLRGRREEKSFMVLYMRAGALKAYFAVNGDSTDLPILQRLIRTRKTLVGREPQLRDPAFAIESLL
jgi:hypothetical protein